jgi:sn-glycerol 3-phosphate transport system substrate-binding protein
MPRIGPRSSSGTPWAANWVSAPTPSPPTFNGLQDQCTVNSVYQGNYTETMTAAIAAFRAGEQPHIVQVFEVGTATMMAAEGAVYPVHQLMEDQGIAFDEADYIPAVISYYSDTDGNMLSLPFNSSTPVMWVNLDLFEANDLEIPTTWEETVEAAARPEGCRRCLRRSASAGSPGR